MKKVCLFLLLFFSCQKKSNDLSQLNFNYIYQKIQVIDKQSLVESENKMIIFQNKKYYVENKILYNNIGQAIEIFTGGSEGFINYLKDTIKGKIPFNSEMRKIKIRVRKSENYIIDNSDTIREFEVIENEKIIKCKKNSDERIIFYKYK